MVEKVDGVDGVEVTTNVPYVPQGNPRQVCDIYHQKSDENYGKNNSAVIIYVHGGGWVRGEKEHASVPCTLLASKGLPAVACSYTLADESQGRNYTTCLKDVASAISWVVTPQAASYLKFTPKNIFLAGHSSGGHLVLMAVLQSKWIDEADERYNNSVSTYKLIRGVIGIGGVYDADTAYEENQDLSGVLRQSLGKDRTKWAKHCPAKCEIQISGQSPGSSRGSPSSLYQAIPQILLIHSHEDEIIDGKQINVFVSRFEPDDSDYESDGEEYSKVQTAEGHYGFHHEMYKKEPLVDLIISFSNNQLSL